MIARETCWKNVWVGAYVEDRNGKIWKVENLIFAGPTAKLRDREGNVAEIPWPPDDRPVTIWETSTQDAVGWFEQALDATVIETRHRA